MWRLDESRALVFTADFITPLVDDAHTWGRIAAANAVSDVYAMGGTPIIALNLVAWNTDALSTELLTEVLRGGREIADHAGFVVAGGHTIDDPEPKYGMAVVGEVHPDRLLRNDALRPGDALILTKPLGIGVISTAIKRGEADPAVVEAAVASMVRTNADAAAAALEFGARGATDVTGFGLLGHLARMAQESGVDASIDVAAVPFLPGVADLASAGLVPGGTERNRAWVEERLDRGGVGDLEVTLLADAQTSGGLLFGVTPDQVDDVLARLRADAHVAAPVGTVRAGTGRLTLR